jgi:hypothetical protein
MTMSDVAEPVAVERPHGILRRELRVWEAFAISVGIMAPTAAMAPNGACPSSSSGLPSGLDRDPASRTPSSA